MAGPPSCNGLPSSTLEDVGRLDPDDDNEVVGGHPSQPGLADPSSVTGTAIARPPKIDEALIQGHSNRWEPLPADLMRSPLDHNAPEPSVVVTPLSVPLRSPQEAARVVSCC
jgi:hypothetical protein